MLSLPSVLALLPFTSFACKDIKLFPLNVEASEFTMVIEDTFPLETSRVYPLIIVFPSYDTESENDPVIEEYTKALTTPFDEKNTSVVYCELSLKKTLTFCKSRSYIRLLWHSERSVQLPIYVCLLPWS